MTSPQVEPTTPITPSDATARLSFGLSGIDHLIDPTRVGYGVENGKTRKIRPLAACIAGPDGVGKSILALSAASTYAAANCPNIRIVYASTDLNYDQALSTWNHFFLDRPKARRSSLRETLEDLYLEGQFIDQVRKRDELLSQGCELIWTSPFMEPKEADQVPFGSIYAPSEPTANRCVHFLDLASYSGGDDWGLINHAVGLLRCRFNNTVSPHLLVVDAVEGLEAMAGTFDRFGLNRSRRSRLAQLIRLTRKANCHVIFVVEQKSQSEKLDEVFISDLVLRLRADQNDEYLQKTVEIEKARSVSHIRGSQELQIRDGSGAGSGAPDDPRIEMGGTTMGYLQVIPSLHQKQKPRS
jgi:hypothetical protein